MVGSYFDKWVDSGNFADVENSTTVENPEDVDIVVFVDNSHYDKNLEAD